ncbi:MAG: universal stress protein [Deltaproteobacteria bacterium]|nr:universal stress protein [Deltaproteobacteria bacterium]
MNEIKQILFPVDLSEASPKIVPLVSTMATKLGAQVHCLFVARTFDHFSMVGLLPYADVGGLHEELTKGAQKGLDEFVTMYFSGIQVTATVIPGYPGEAILDYAQANKIDMIIMGTHGRKGVEKIIFGSVAEHVVKNSTIPVLTIKPV